MTCHVYKRAVERPAGRPRPRTAPRANSVAAPDGATGKCIVTDETLLIQRVRSGDTAAFEQLYRRHAGRIYALCRRMTGNTSEAEDRTQEIFVRAWEKLPAFAGNSAFYTWLHRIAVNHLISAHRKQQSRVRLEQADEDAAPARHISPPNQLPQRIDLEAAIARLPERARLVFVLHDVEGYKHDEIAQLTGMAPGTSKAQTHRARKLLREMLT